MVDLSAYADKYSPEGLAAIQVILAAKPDQIAIHTRPDGSFDADSFVNGTLGWWQGNGYQVADKLDQFGPEMKLFDALGYTINPAAGGAAGTLASNNPNAVSLEQQLFGQILQNYINPDMAADAQRRADANGIVGNINRSLDQAIATNNEVNGGIFDGQGYLKQNPDVAAWAQDAVAKGQYADLNSAAKAHYETFGK